jgi:Protein of unknown function (DUF3024)
VALPEPALDKIRRFCDARTPPEMRDQINLHATTRGNSVTIVDSWRPPGEDWIRTSIAQLRYDAATPQWSLYCADRNGCWHLYPDLAPTTKVERLIAEIDRDPTCIFWG